MVEINNQTKKRLDEKAVKKTAEKFLAKFNLRKKTVSVAFVNSIAMRRLNKRYRQKDKTTDVLSFAGQGDFLGEIVMDYEQIKKQAKKFSQSVQEELTFVLVHGLLHLIGYTDETEKDEQAMIKKGKSFIKNSKV